jgi:hypothetical protein
VIVGTVCLNNPQSPRMDSRTLILFSSFNPCPHLVHRVLALQVLTTTHQHGLPQEEDEGVA